MKFLFLFLSLVVALMICTPIARAEYESVELCFSPKRGVTVSETIRDELGLDKAISYDVYVTDILSEMETRGWALADAMTVSHCCWSSQYSCARYTLHRDTLFDVELGNLEEDDGL
jgi:hypothetical protein